MSDTTSFSFISTFLHFLQVSQDTVYIITFKSCLFPLISCFPTKYFSVRKAITNYILKVLWEY